MSNINTQPFKSSSRSPRTVSTEESFAGGMNYTDAPLTENFVKLLVNYDIDSTGSVLSPRPGLRVEKEYACGDPFSEEHAVEYTLEHFPADACITDLKRFYKGNEAYARAILGWPKPTNSSTPNVKGYATLLKDSYNEYKTLALHDPCFVMPRNTKMHNMRLKDSIKNLKIVGTTAWNNDYYFFSKDSNLYKVVVEGEALKEKLVKPKKLEPTQVTNGYNMLAADPYAFTSAVNDAAGSTILLTGLLPYTTAEKSKLYLKPRDGDSVSFNVFYTIKSNNTTKYKFVFEWSEPTSGTWNHFGTVKKVPKKEGGKMVEVKKTLQGIPGNLTYIRVSAYKEVKKDSDTYNDYPEATTVYVLDLTSSTNVTQFSDDLPNYDLTTAKGLCFWADRLVCYGCEKDPTMLFVSDVNDPTYFPYPNNIDTFDEPIMYVTPYLNSNLLVFTKTQLYMLSLSADYLTWTQTLIQSNLDITEWDLNCVQIVKNMVLFKSGNYYYMVVPKVASATGLTIAPISKNMENFFDNFEQNIELLFKEVYNYSKKLTLIHYYNYLDYESVHNIYMFQTTEGVCVNVDLIYNSTKRYWKIYVYESSGALTPFVDSATDRGSLISLAQAPNEKEPRFQVQRYSSNNLQKKDCYYKDGKYYDSAQIFKNYQYISTGYREIASNLKKRFRELQFELNNISQHVLKFYINFYIDGDPRRYCLKDVTDVYYDKTDQKQYVLFSQQIEESMAKELPSATTLDMWELDESLFPESFFWKIRVPVSGKGYTPQMQILSQNEEAYDLLNLSWVYRMMYTR